MGANTAFMGSMYDYHVDTVNYDGKMVRSTVHTLF